jgi:hypothetical protein
MNATHPSGPGLAEVIPIRRREAVEAERLAELDERIREAFEELHALIAERFELERGAAA